MRGTVSIISFPPLVPCLHCLSSPFVIVLLMLAVYQFILFFVSCYLPAYKAYLQSMTAFTQDEHTRSHNRQTATPVCNVSCCFMDWKWGDAHWLRSWYDTNIIINCERITPNPCSRSECCKSCAYMYAVQLLRYIVFDLVNSSLTSLTNELSNQFDRHQLAQWHSTRDNVDTTT